MWRSKLLLTKEHLSIKDRFWLLEGDYRTRIICLLVDIKATESCDIVKQCIINHSGCYYKFNYIQSIVPPEIRPHHNMNNQDCFVTVVWGVLSLR